MFLVFLSSQTLNAQLSALSSRPYKFTRIPDFPSLPSKIQDFAPLPRYERPSDRKRDQRPSEAVKNLVGGGGLVFSKDQRNLMTLQSLLHYTCEYDMQNEEDILLVIRLRFHGCTTRGKGGGIERTHSRKNGRFHRTKDKSDAHGRRGELHHKMCFLSFFPCPSPQEDPLFFLIKIIIPKYFI